VFFDSVYVVPDPAGMAMEPGAGITAPFVNPDDNIFGAGINAIILDDTDTTPPVITASLAPVDVEEDEGLFRVEFSATDENLASVNALLNGEPVTNGQLVELEIDDDNEVEFDDGILEMEAPSFELIVTAIDDSGNTGVGEEENESNESHNSEGSNGSDGSDSSNGSDSTASTTCPDDTDGSESSDSSHD